MKNYIQKTLIAHIFGYLALILTHILWSLIIYKSAAGGDTGIIIVWAGIFLTIFYFLFILIPRKKIERISLTSKYYTFAFGFAIYSLIGFIILIGWMFLNSSFNGVFLDAFFYGLIFGFTYHRLAHRNSSFVIKDFIILLSIPTFILCFYIIILPKLFPSFAFKIVPKETQNEIVKETLPKFKIGDNFNDLKNALPGYFNNIDCNYSTSALMEDYQYSLVINNCKITKIEYGPRKNNNGMTEMTIEEPIEKK